MSFGTVLQAGAAIIGAMGQSDAADQAKATGQHNRAVAASNAITLENNALNAEREGAIAEDRHRRNVTRLLGQQRVAYSKAGVTSSGTPTMVEQDSATEAELDALLIKYSALTRANAFRAQAAGMKAQGEMAAYEGESRADAARLASLGTLIGGAGKVYGSMKATTPDIPTFSGGQSYGDAYRP
jgi:hypothetical protein